MDDSERAIETEQLLKELSEAATRKAALLVESQEFAAMLPEIRSKFGNPFLYSHPKSAG